MVAEEGVLRSTDFGSNFDVIAMPTSWQFNRSWGPPMEVSNTSADVVWSGGGIQEDKRLAVSTDAGFSFSETNNYPLALMGTVTGIATHPSDSNTAYALFSQANGPKILKTKDLGQNWKDISGYITNIDECTNGYPNVATYCLIVMPFDTAWLWAGTEIGLFESRDGGLNWEMVVNGLPPVSIWEMKIVNDQIVLATHGRGIWTLDMNELNPVSTSELDNYFISAFQISPNSISHSAVISFELRYPQEMSIHLTNLAGQSELLQSRHQFSEGRHDIEFHRKERISGTYIIHFNSSNKIFSRQIMIL